MLALIGASSAALSLENVRVEKDMRTYINRTNNCESANLDKQVIASIRQQAAIAAIDRQIGLTSLPASLQQAAHLRLEMPDASLQELSEASQPHVGKSGINHRLKKLETIAQELRT